MATILYIGLAPIYRGTMAAANGTAPRRMHAPKHARTRTHVDACTRTHMHMCTQAYAPTCTAHVCACTRAHTHPCARACAHTHVCTHARPRTNHCFSAPTRMHARTHARMHAGHSTATELLLGAPGIDINSTNKMGMRCVRAPARLPLCPARPSAQGGWVGGRASTNLRSQPSLG